MFTGLIEEIGTIKGIQKGRQSSVLEIIASKVLDHTQIGDSIATNGICLTVTHLSSNSFKVDVMPETMERSNIGDLQVGSKVNLERAIRVGDRLGGHLVSGHVDGVGKIISRLKKDNATLLTCHTTKDLTQYMIPKGSIAIDGVSLTLISVKEQSFSVSIIPQTASDTILLHKKVGDRINLECDQVVKIQNKSSNITMGFLEEVGFLD